jgi:predicted DsbA family dithiol-disulfide isomerase
MKVEIWSDVMCPFCYIGKRRFEDALQQFAHKDEVEIEWKSFQLNPDMKTDPSVNINQYLANKKGWTLQYAQQMNAYVTSMAADAGLTYNMDKAVVANSFNAHRFTHYAKKHGKGIEAEEQLFKAYFTDGKNVDDADTLAHLGAEIGLNPAEITSMLAGNEYAEDVKHDIAEAGYWGISGVPFFVMNSKYAISGAQAVSVFTETLDKAFSEFKPANTMTDGLSCEPGGNC